MRTKLLSAALIIAFVSFASTGFAQTHTPRVTHRQVHQQKRIAHGAKSGELTKRETAHLEARQAKVRHDKRVAKSDGKVTPRERAKLNREQNRTSRAIYRQKHDTQTRH